jgi:hypothetical protein
MKKKSNIKLLMSIILFAIAIAIVPVNAKENRLYFTESKNRLYYESSLIDENVFMKHLDMVPGKTYTDELIIENGTKTKYSLYFKVIPTEQSSEAEDFLENILMRIYIDGVEFYEGKTTGMDYSENGKSLQDTVYLGDIKPSSKHKMVVETKLSEDYMNTEYTEESLIDWSFYAQYQNSKPIEIVKVPNTMINSIPYISIISIIIIVIGLSVLLYAKNKKN